MPGASFAQHARPSPSIRAPPSALLSRPSLLTCTAGARVSRASCCAQTCPASRCSSCAAPVLSEGEE
eukprot:5241980-Alexandrium_andersonii.AAC.1